MYPSGYTQDTSRYIRIRILITNPPKLDNKPPLTLGKGPWFLPSLPSSYQSAWAAGGTLSRGTPHALLLLNAERADRS
jgi:hypothetical protein